MYNKQTPGAVQQNPPPCPQHKTTNLKNLTNQPIKILTDPNQSPQTYALLQVAPSLIQLSTLS